MSRATWVLLLSLVPAALAAQASEATLQHRIEVLTAKQAVLLRQLERRDSLALAAADLVVIGKAPLFLRVPAWAVPATAAPVAAVVDSWSVRIGPLFSSIPSETLVVALRSDTAGWSRGQVASLVAEFPAVVRVNARSGAQARVQRMLGSRLASWLGPGLPAATFDESRRDAVFALTSDTTGTGARCLDGDVTACLTVLRWPSTSLSGARRSLVASVLGRAGIQGWSGLAADTTAPPESRIAAIGGASYDRLVGEWIARLRAPHPDGPATYAGASLLALAWAGALLLLFVWRLTWHRA